MLDFLQYGFFVRAIVAGALIGYLASNLGVFVILRKLSFFSEAVSHSSLTGIAIGLLIGIDPLLGAIGFSILVALAIASLAKRRGVSMDTVIGVSLSTAMAIGVIIIGRLQGYRVDLMGYLFGDILGVSKEDVALIAVIAFLAVGALFFFFRTWTKIAFHSDLAKVEGIAVELHDRLFLALLALVVALGLKLVGAILIAPMVIIPAAAAKNVSWNLRSMFVVSSILGVVASTVGLVISYYADTASGPTMVLVAAAMFGASFLFRSKVATA